LPLRVQVKDPRDDRGEQSGEAHVEVHSVQADHSRPMVATRCTEGEAATETKIKNAAQMTA